jgi:hypothetical protein
MTIRHFDQHCPPDLCVGLLRQYMDRCAPHRRGFDAARMATRTSFEALAGQPKDVRAAILTLSTRPELIVKLNERGRWCQQRMPSPPRTGGRTRRAS